MDLTDRNPCPGSAEAGWLRLHSGREGEPQTMSDVRLSPRERLVLTAIIDQYIATGEPVASQAIARLFADRDGLSRLRCAT